MMETPVVKQDTPHDVPTLVDLFLTFVRLGVTAFGGPAMIPYVGEFVVKRKKWMDPQAFKGGVALAQSIPGATLMQTVAYTGLRLKGLPGAVVSYVAFSLPAFILMLVFSAVYTSFGTLPRITSVFSGLQVVVIAIVAHAAYSFGKSSLKHYIHVLLAAASAAAFWLGVSPFFVILGAAAAGLIFLKGTVETQTAKGQRRLISPITLIGLLGVLVLGLLCLYLLRPDLFGLAVLMLKVDLFAFGGGFASLPLMLNQVVHVRGWMDAKTFMDGIALGQVTPGPIVITAAFVGFLKYRLLGAIVGTIAIFVPSFTLVLLIAPFFDRLKGSVLFSKGIHGVLASFVGLLFFVCIRFATAVPWDLLRVALFLAALAAILKKIDLLYIVLIAAAISLFLF
jgi:chromate transporter